MSASVRHPLLHQFLHQLLHGFPRLFRNVSCSCTALLAGTAAPARAQVVIPHGDFGDGWETWLLAAVSLLLLCFAVWRYHRGDR